MPKGVEHFDYYPDTTDWFLMTSPLMPKGVEHVVGQIEAKLLME